MADSVLGIKSWEAINLLNETAANQVAGQEVFPSRASRCTSARFWYRVLRPLFPLLQELVVRIREALYLHAVVPNAHRRQRLLHLVLKRQQITITAPTADNANVNSSLLIAWTLPHSERSVTRRISLSPLCTNAVVAQKRTAHVHLFCAWTGKDDRKDLNEQEREQLPVALITDWSFDAATNSQRAARISWIDVYW